MNLLFDSPSWILSAAIIVAVSIFLSFIAFYFIRKSSSLEELQKSHDVVGFTFSIIGILYGVILGLVVINVQDRYSSVEEAVHTEAVLLADLYQDAAFFTPTERDRIRTSLRDYINHVLQEEWGNKTIAKIHPKTRDTIKEIWNAYYLVDLTSDKVKIWYAESISKVNSFLNARLTRQFNSWEHLGSMMWSMLLVGAIITICFMFFFGLENFLSHAVMIALLTGYLSFMLYLVYSLDNVVDGSLSVQPVALEQVYALFDQWDQDSLNEMSLRQK